MKPPRADRWLGGEPSLWDEPAFWSALRAEDPVLWARLRAADGLRARGLWAAASARLNAATPGWRVELLRAKAALSRACGAEDADAPALARAAIRHARRALHAQPGRLPAYGVLACAHALLGENYAAKEVMRRAAAVRPGSALPWLALARLGWKEAPGQARAALERALRLDPGLAAAHGLRGELLRRRGLFAAALRSLGRAVALAPGQSRLLLWRARARLAAGLRAGARRDLGAALALEPQRARAHAEAGRALEAARDLAGADRAYSRALRLEPGPRDLAEAVETLESRDEMLAGLRFRRHEVRARLGRFAASLADLEAAHRLDLKHIWRDAASLERALRRRPAQAGLRAWRGRLALDRGEHARAEAELSAALAGGPRSGWALAWRGEARLRLGRDEEARRDARQALALEPGYAKAHALAAELDLKRGRFAPAARRAARAVALYHSAVWGYAVLGEALLGAGRHEGARRAFDQALAWDPAYRRLYPLRAVACFNLGQAAAARRDLARARALGLPAAALDALAALFRDAP